ncbi:MAG: tRNA pseudouridine(38-40) synthase TruA [Oscillospiraceae bacterium]|nr:tRNA pseudouridine(38-40) synthase TruA [Oscillospiraceae bacterium]
MPTRRFKVTIAYKGAAYHGFQRQINAVGIQNILEDKLSVLTDKRVEIEGCSRTDKGVSANMFVFSFSADCRITCDGIVRGMNSALPMDIAVLDCEEAEDDFHARYSCKGKEYRYFILNTPCRNPFLYETSFHYPKEINLDLMNRAAEYFVGTHDFTSFCGTSNLKENPVRTVWECHGERTGDMICFTVSGNGFLYNMVRIMVGTLLWVNEGRFSPEDMPRILEEKDRRSAGKTAPACGLFLNKVMY